MDRSDEFERDGRDEAGVSTDEKRAGDVLGLGGGPVPKSSGDPVTEHDPESAARRRERMRSGEDESAAPEPRERAGATGIDMGAGGSGTGISGE